MTKIKFTIFSFAGLALILSCGGDKIENQWADREITIDGKFTDWDGIAQYT